MQNAAYELRISDWSSDLCSSDLIWTNHDQETFVKAYEKGRLFMFLTGIAAMLFVGLLSPVIISILFGKKYAEAHAILSILAIGIPIRFIATSVGSLLVSGRNMRNKSYIMGVVAVINLGSNALLIPVYGLYGAAIDRKSTRLNSSH